MINDCRGDPLTPRFLIGSVSSVKLLSFVLFLSVSASALHVALGQSTEAAEWPTGSFDQQRDGWQRNETKLTADNAKNLRLLWKLKTDNKPMGMQSFREPVIVAGVHTAGGVKTLAIFAGSSDAVFAIDVDNGSLVWQKDLKWSSDKPQEPGQGAGFICNNALTATPVVTPAGAAQRFVYVLSNDGYLHTMDPATGEEKDPAVQMLPGVYGKAYGLNLVNNVVYTVDRASLPRRSQSALRRRSHHQEGLLLHSRAGRNLRHRRSRDRQRWHHLFRNRRRGLRRRRRKAIHHRAGLYLRQRSTDPQGLLHPQQPRLADQARSRYEHHPGRLSLSREGSPGGLGQRRPLFSDGQQIAGRGKPRDPALSHPLVSNKNVNFQTEGSWGSFASWEGKDGTRWVLAPIGGPVTVDFPISYGPTPNGGIIALKVTETGGKTELTPAWVSRDMMSAEPPVVANGVVYVLAAGEFTAQANDEDGGLYSFEERVKRSIPAKLYALDAVTGKELYSSGDQIASFLHQAGIAVAGGRVIFGTFDGTIYCFGLE